MSDYIIHNIGLSVKPKLDFNQFEEKEHPVAEYPNYYIGKILGGIGNSLDLNRTRRGGGNENVPNCVLRNEKGIALIRIHNKEDLTIYDLPENTENNVEDCIGVPQASYPFGYVVVDYRDGKCQIAIEKTPQWDSKTVTIRNCLQDFFNDKLSESLGISVEIKEKTISTEFERFIDQRITDHGDVIESFTFQYANMKRKPTTRIPPNMSPELSAQMDMQTKILEMYGAISGTTTMQLDSNVDKEKLKQLSTVVAYCSDNAFDLSVKFRDYGEYTCNESIIAKYPMNDIIISNFKDFSMSDILDADHDLSSWLDDVFIKVKGENDANKIPTKPI